MNNSKTVQYFINKFSDILTKEQKKIVIEKWANEEIEKESIEIFNQQCIDAILFAKRKEI